MAQNTPNRANLRVINGKPTKVDLVPVFGRPPRWLARDAQRLFLNLGKQFITPEKFLPIDSDCFAAFCSSRAMLERNMHQIAALRAKRTLPQTSRRELRFRLRWQRDWLIQCRDYARELLLEDELMTPR